MSARVIRGETVPPADRQPDAVDGAVYRLVDQNARHYRNRSRFWGAVGLILAALWLATGDRWAWISAAVDAVLYLYNVAGLLVTGTDFYHAETRRRVLAETLLRRSGRNYRA